MRTNIEIEQSLVTEGLKITGLKTKKDLVNFALKELLRRRDQQEILALRGKFHWQGDLEKMRANRFEKYSV